MHATKEQLRALEMLTARADFLAVQSSGIKWISHGLVLQIRENAINNKIRVGYTVTKKTRKSAVARNRIKRRLRAVAADILPVHAKRGYDYVLVGRQDTQDRPYDVLLSDLKWCLKKTGLYQEKIS